MVLGMEVGLSSGDFVLDGDPAPPPLKGDGAPKFSAHGYCGQMAGCIKTPLGTEVGLDAGHIVLDGDPVRTQPPTAASPHFSAHVYCDQTVAHLSNC